MVFATSPFFVSVTKNVLDTFEPHAIIKGWQERHIPANKQGTYMNKTTLAITAIGAQLVIDFALSLGLGLMAIGPIIAAVICASGYVAALIRCFGSNWYKMVETFYVIFCVSFTLTGVIGGLRHTF